jgi:uncharacterized membrane protein YdjX (TVP38/TMEM64 family)
MRGQRFRMTALRLLALVAVVAALGTAALTLPLGQWLLAGAAWAKGHHYEAAALFVGAYALAAVLVVPGTLLTLAAGFVFGLTFGVVLVSAGSVLGAVAAFVVGRFLARRFIAARIAGRPRFRALDAAARRDGFAIVLLARMSPLLPYNILNYAFGLTSVRFRDYALASWIGMLPATVVYVYIGSLASDLAAVVSGDVDAGWAARGLLVGGFVATVGLTVLLAKRATRALRGRLDAEVCAPPATGEK